MPSFSVQRSVEIQADPMRVFQLVSDFSTWTTWSPWLIAEPETQVTVSADPRSVGSTYEWNGNITGAGQITHRKLIPGQLVDDELLFLKPFKSKAQVRFELAPASRGTKLTWVMDSSLPWFMFWMIPMMKTFIGMDYRRGLEMIKDLVETGRVPSKTVVHGIEQTAALRMAGIASRCSVDGVGPSMEQAFSKARQEFQQLGLSTNGLMISAYTKFHMKEGVFEYISGFTIPETVEIPAGSSLKLYSIPAGKAFRVEHIGSYRHLGNPWSAANQIVRSKKMKQQKHATYEIYRTTPPSTPDHELRTDIYLPLR